MSNSVISKQIVVDVIVFLLLCLPILVVLALGEPVVSGFWCRDQSLNYPYKPDSVPQTLLVVLGFGGPFVMMLMNESIRAASKARQAKQFRWELLSLFKAYGVFLFGMAANCLVTDCLKFSVGRHRPHFFDICKPNFEAINCTMDGMGVDRFVMDYECTNTEVDRKLLRDSRLSFPSGHASLSIYSALFTIFYLQLRMKINFSHLLRPTLQLGLFILALLCCVSRVNDHKHFASDVLAGAVIGLSISSLTFYKVGRQVIPSPEPETQSPKAAKGKLPRSTSMESEPQTPTPLLRPEHLVLSHSNHTFRSSGAPMMIKGDLANNV